MNGVGGHEKMNFVKNPKVIKIEWVGLLEIPNKCEHQRVLHSKWCIAMCTTCAQL